MTFKVAINGRFLTHYASGVVRVATEITKAIDELLVSGEIEGEFRLLCPYGAASETLDLKAITVKHVGRGLQGHMWEQLALPVASKNDTLLCLGNTAPLLSLLARRQVAVMIHDLSYRLYPHAYTWKYRLGHSFLAPALLRYADPIFTVSQTEKKLIEHLAPLRQGAIVVAQNGSWQDAPCDEAKRNALRSRANGYALYVGSFSERKNIHGIQAAAIRLAREFGIATKLAGSPGSIFQYTPPEIPDDVADYIEFVGHVQDKNQLEQLYRGSSLFLFPSFYEASPLPPTEAMYFGCPVVASDIPSIRERCGDAVAYCNPNSVDSIVEAAGKVISDERYASDLILKGVAKQKTYSWRIQAKTILSALKEQT